MCTRVWVDFLFALKLGGLLLLFISYSVCSFLFFKENVLAFSPCPYRTRSCTRQLQNSLQKLWRKWSKSFCEYTKVHPSPSRHHFHCRAVTVNSGRGFASCTSAYFSRNVMLAQTRLAQCFCVWYSISVQKNHPAPHMSRSSGAGAEVLPRQP